MTKLIIDTTLGAAIKLSWNLISTGERVVAFSERWGANELRAGFAELILWRVGRHIMVVGERIELGLHRIALRLGYEDGELSGIVAWPATPSY